LLIYSRKLGFGIKIPKKEEEKMNPRVEIYAHLDESETERVWRWLRARDLLAGVNVTQEEILWAEGEVAIGNVEGALADLNLQPAGATTFLPSRSS
jgi:hypothetical protein